MRAMLTANVPEFTRPTNSSMSLAGSRLLGSLSVSESHPHHCGSLGPAGPGLYPRRLLYPAPGHETSYRRHHGRHRRRPGRNLRGRRPPGRVRLRLKHGPQSRTLPRWLPCFADDADDGGEMEAEEGADLGITVFTRPMGRDDGPISRLPAAWRICGKVGGGARRCGLGIWTSSPTSPRCCCIPGRRNPHRPGRSGDSARPRGFRHRCRPLQSADRPPGPGPAFPRRWTGWCPWSARPAPWPGPPSRDNCSTARRQDPRPSRHAPDSTPGSG